MVLEAGPYTTRAGFSGDDCPQYTFPSVRGSDRAGKPAYDEQKIFPGSEVLSCAASPEILEGLWREAFRRLRVSPGDYPLLLVEPVDLSDKDRHHRVEMAFEQFGVPAVYMGRAPVMAAFAMGRHTGLVLKVGAGGSSVTPVFEGIPLMSAVATSPIGGRALDSACHSLLLETGIDPGILFASHKAIETKSQVGLGEPPVISLTAGFKGSATWRAWQQQKITSDFCESIVQVPESPGVGERDLALRPPKYYEFPCGYNKNFGAERFKIGELLFSGTEDAPGVVDLVKMSLDRLSEKNGSEQSRATAPSALHPQYHHQITQTLIVAGGATLTPGFMDRLGTELTTRLPLLGRMRVQATGTAGERRQSSWLGGSILGSLGTMQAFWLTAEEYREHGQAAVSKKFP